MDTNQNENKHSTIKKNQLNNLRLNYRNESSSSTIDQTRFKSELLEKTKEEMVQDIKGDKDRMTKNK